MAKVQIADGMRIEWDAEIEMDDGLRLRADIFRPVGDGRYPVLMSYGPYGKGLAFQDGYRDCWDLMVDRHPDVARASTGKYQVWEVADPEKWVPHGYVCIRVDSRGAGRSPGFMDVWSPRETRDFHDCIEWAGTQSWSNGKVGLAGISYYATNQWQVAALNPPHLAAICPWEGLQDFYREAMYHGGILNTFPIHWLDKQVKSVQNGLGRNGPVSRATGEFVCGDETLDDDALAKNRADSAATLRKHPLDDDHWKTLNPILENIRVPVFSAANWGGQGLHPRGNFEGFLRSGSRQKWLEVHGLTHWSLFYTDYGVNLQRKFFDYFLKGEDTGWSKQPKVLLQVRRLDSFEERHENEWPLARTQWTSMGLDFTRRSLVAEPVGATIQESLSFDAKGKGVTFKSEPLEEETEFTGPLSLKLFVSSSTDDADLFVIFKVFEPDGREVVFDGALDPHTPAAQGWLRASHRKLDLTRSLPHQPVHTHDEIQKLIPGEVVELDIEIWPTSVVVPAGYRLGLTIQGTDYDWGGPPARLGNLKFEMRGCGPFLHDDPVDRPDSVFAGVTTLHSSATQISRLLLPTIPPKKN